MGVKPLLRIQSLEERRKMGWICWYMQVMNL